MTERNVTLTPERNEGEESNLRGMDSTQCGFDSTVFA